MSFKDTFQKILKERKDIDIIRYEAARGVFIFTSFGFFVTFFLVGSGYYREVLLPILSPLYILTITALNVFIFFFIKKYFGERKIIFSVLFGICVLLSVLSLSVIF